MINTTIHTLMKNMLIGKELKYCKSWKQVNQQYSVACKKSKNVTDKQFMSGNRKFIMLAHRTKTIGTYSIYEVSKIVDIRISYGDWDGSNSLSLVLENGHQTDLEVDTEIVEIEPNVLMLKY